MSYVDGFVLAVPAKKIDVYKKMAKKAAKIWMEHGAVEYKECIGDDMTAKGMFPFPKMISAKKGEVVVFAFIVYKSRAHRDKVNKKVMSDPRLMCDPADMPFDCKNMAYGGFKTIVEF